MKKQTSQVLAQVQPKPVRKLFGISSDELKAVHGGGGVIINAPTRPPGGGVG